MGKKEPHPIRNGVIATVIGGILLSFWSPFRAVLGNLFTWLWALVIATWDYLWSLHDVYGLVILILVLVSIPTVVNWFRMLMEKRPIDLYKEDELFGAKWCWYYSNGTISNLWCLCPQCENELIYSEIFPDRYLAGNEGKLAKTEFICEKCDVTRASLNGGKNDALNHVKREIRRKIRTEEWRSHQSSSHDN